MSMSLLSLGLCAGAGIVAVPSAVFAAEVLASYLPRRPELRREGEPMRLAVLVPAHDEAAGIRRCVESLLAELGPGDRLVVVADNCRDETAQLARAAGAEVIERQDEEQKGKGYALSWGAKHLGADPPDVVVVMDADCQVTAGSLRGLARRALASGRPTQAIYLLQRADGGRGFGGVSAFAFLVRNLVRPRGLKRLGLPCELTGTGMAFPWAMYRDAPATGGFLAEDRLLGHELALAGTAPLLDEDTVIVGQLAGSDRSSFKQRRRWEHGGLSLLLGTAPRLMGHGLRRGDPGLLAQGFDAAVPPLALLVLLEIASTLLTLAIGLLGGSFVPFLVAAAGLGVLGLGVAVAWWASGRELLPVAELLRIPRYVLWKLPLYASFARQGAHGEWERTERG